MGSVVALMGLATAQGWSGVAISNDHALSAGKSHRISILGRMASSTPEVNWAGYAAEAPSADINDFVDAWGDWTVPAVTCTSATSREVMWVGLDGAEKVSNSVEQFGTTANCTNSVPAYYLWWEMDPAPEVKITKVHPGDLIDGGVFWAAGTQYIISINVYKNVKQYFDKGKPYFTWTRTRYSPGNHLNDSAECILEVQPGSNVADFGTATFDRCLAIAYDGKRYFDITKPVSQPGVPLSVHKFYIRRSGITDVSTGSPYYQAPWGKPAAGHDHSWNETFKHS